MSAKITTVRGEDLTQVMIDDYSPHLSDPDAFAESVRKDEKRYGCHVTRIECIPFPDGKPGIMEKRYYFEEESECPDWELNALVVGVESL